MKVHISRSSAMMVTTRSVFLTMMVIINSIISSSSSVQAFSFNIPQKQQQNHIGSYHHHRSMKNNVVKQNPSFLKMSNTLEDETAFKTEKKATSFQSMNSLLHHADEHILIQTNNNVDSSNQQAQAQAQQPAVKPFYEDDSNDARTRRLFLSSVLMGTSIAIGGSGSSSSSNIFQPPNANASELEWTASPVNKRSGITVFQAEKNGYNLQFITYLSRFLISFDAECQQWWFKRAGDIPRMSTTEQVDMLRLKQFGSFSASVEVGLQEYVGPDGPKRLMISLLNRYCPDVDEIRSEREAAGLPPLKQAEEERRDREIKEARRQIVLLFALLETYQPVEEITKTLAAIDNASIQSVSILEPGSGYAPGYGNPAVTFPPPDAGEGYETATGRAILRPSGRFLRIDLEKRGFGYTKPPTISITPPLAEAFGSPTACEAKAKAFLFRDGVNKGRIERIEVVDPGSGYADDEIIRVKFSAPETPLGEGGEFPVAKAIVECEVAKIEITNPGSGYAAEKPLTVTIDPPPLTARINLNDPMMMKVLERSATNKKDQDKKPSIYDPALYSPKAWNQAKVGGGGGCVGRECYDKPVVAVAYPKAQKDSYTSFRKEGDEAKPQSVETAVKKRSTASVSAISSGGESNSIEVLPFLSGRSSSTTLLKLLPSGIGLQYNEELCRYELALGEDIDELQWNTAPGSKPVDPDFGPRGRSPIERERDLDVSTFFRFMFSGAISCSSVHLALTPIDVCKTKVQTNPKVYTDFFTALKLLSEEEGLSSFFYGWAPTFVGFFVNGGVSYSATEFFRRYYTTLAGVRAPSVEIPILLAAGITSGFIGSFTLGPSEAIRIRSVAQPDYADNVVGVTSRMIKEEGFASLFSAVPAVILKEIPFTMAKFTIFYVSTSWMYETFPSAREDLQLSLLVSLVGGILGGVTASVVSNPADATISEMKKTKSDLGPIATAKSLYEEYGAKAFARGLGIRMFFYSLIVSLQFLVYDYVRFSLGIGSDDLKLYLNVLGGALNESGGPI